MLKNSLHHRNTKVVINHRVGNFILNSMLSNLSIKSLHTQVIQKLHVELNLYAGFVLSFIYLDLFIGQSQERRSLNSLNLLHTN